MSTKYITTKGTIMVKGRGGGKTPNNIVELINQAVTEKSLRSVSKSTGLGLAALSRYSQGVGEPTQATLEKLAVYFNVSVSELRGYEERQKPKPGISTTKPVSASMIEKQNEDIKEFDEILNEYEVYVQEYLNHLPKEIWSTHGVNLVKYVVRKAEDKSITTKDFLWWP